MNQNAPGRRTLVIAAGYHAADSSDQHQLVALTPAYEHHGCPVLFMGPADAPVSGVGPHWARNAGPRAYIGQASLDRQYAQLKLLRDEIEPFDHYLWNDSDSFLLTPEIPEYVYTAPPKTCWSNEVHDFRVDDPRWGPGFHKPLPPIAMQPPYFFDRAALEAFVEHGAGIVACPTCPFIDWYFVQLCHAAGVTHLRFPGPDGASCENVTELGKAVMREQVGKGAIWLHSIKTGAVMRDLFALRASLPPGSFPA